MLADIACNQEVAYVCLHTVLHQVKCCSQTFGSIKHCLCLQAMPALSCCCIIIWVADVIYSIGSAQGMAVVVGWSAQSIVMLLVIAGSTGCLITCLVMPHMTHKLRTRSCTPITIKRMNLLGLVRLMHCMPSIHGLHSCSAKEVE